MQREQKEQFVASMRNDLERAEGVLFVDYTGLTVEMVENLRKKFRESGITYQVVKNTLMKRVLDETPFADASNYLKGSPTGVVIGFEDPVTPAKIAFEYRKDNEKLRIKGAVVDKKAVSEKQAEALSKMPSKGELQASIVTLALSPGRMLAAQLKNPAGRVVGAIEALVKRLESAEG